MDPDPDHLPPDLDTIESLARKAIDGLPSPYREAAATILLRVADFAPEDILQEMEIDDPFGLTGLYEGIPLTERSVSDPPLQPDVIWLFRRPILDEWADRGSVDLGALVTHVMVHELAHHFGWSDDAIAAIDRWWE